jgi:hypothetical protein
MLVPLSLAVLSAFPGPGGEPCASDPGYVLHEWGTFTTVTGSNGVLLEGLSYDDHQLPDFVYQRTRSPAGFEGVRCKMETPVIYFYSDRARELRVKVGFQAGLLTQWYPQVRELAPPVGADAPGLRGGLLDWGKIRVLAPGEGLDRLPSVGRALNWEHARAVDANVILRRTPDDQYERFLFYRGLGSFSLPLSAWIEDENRTEGEGALSLSNVGDEPLAGAIVLARHGHSLRAARLAPLSHAQSTHVEIDGLPEIELDALMQLTARLLEEQGLYPREAEAMVHTWQQSYFESDGLRVLYPLPRAEVDWLLPLSVSPAPRESVRVLVGRLDVLTPRAEQEALALLPRVQSAADAEQLLGRFAIPILHRLSTLAEGAREQERVRTLTQLLEQSF